MQHTPLSDIHNTDVLRLMRTDYRWVVEVGSASGALAKIYRELNPACDYLGIEIDENYAAASRRYCSDVQVGNIEHFDDPRIHDLAMKADCWIFADVIEHLYDPWALLQRIRKFSRPDTDIIASIPNLQNWALQRCINSGAFTYMDSGLLDRTHIRWFTRSTILRLFSEAGFQPVNLIDRVMHAPDKNILAAIRTMAQACGNDPDQAERDAIPFQYVIRATSH